MSSFQELKEPPVLSDVQLYGYLREMTRQLNLALQQVDSGSFVTAGSGLGATVSAQAQTAAQAAVQDEANQLRSLIIKTARIVEERAQQIEQTLESSYVAISDFGQYEEQIKNDIIADSSGILQTFEQSATIQSLIEKTTSFDSYAEETKGYIKTGIIDYNGNEPIIGVAIGQGLKETTENGKTVVSKVGLSATFTSEKLSFYDGGNEVAYLSNNELNISNARILNKMTFGKWEITRSNGFTIKYVG